MITARYDLAEVVRISGVGATTVKQALRKTVDDGQLPAPLDGFQRVRRWYITEPALAAWMAREEEIARELNG